MKYLWPNLQYTSRVNVFIFSDKYYMLSSLLWDWLCYSHTGNAYLLMSLHSSNAFWSCFIVFFFFYSSFFTHLLLFFSVTFIRTNFVSTLSLNSSITLPISTFWSPRIGWMLYFIKDLQKRISTRFINFTKWPLSMLGWCFGRVYTYNIIKIMTREEEYGKAVLVGGLCRILSI